MTNYLKIEPCEVLADWNYTLDLSLSTDRKEEAYSILFGTTSGYANPTSFNTFVWPSGYKVWGFWFRLRTEPPLETDDIIIKLKDQANVCYVYWEFLKYSLYNLWDRRTEAQGLGGATAQSYALQGSDGPTLWHWYEIKWESADLVTFYVDGVQAMNANGLNITLGTDLDVSITVGGTKTCPPSNIDYIVAADALQYPPTMPEQYNPGQNTEKGIVLIYRGSTLIYPLSNRDDVDSIEVQRVINDVDTAQCRLDNEVLLDINAGDVLKIEIASTGQANPRLIFNGEITEAKQVREDGLPFLDISAKGWAKVLEEHEITQSYPIATNAGTICKGIVADVTDPTPEDWEHLISVNNVQTTSKTRTIDFEGMSMLDALKKLSNVTTYDFFVDPEKDLHWFPRSLAFISSYAHWHLNETSGTLVSDSSGNGHNGICVNMEDSDWQAGKLNNCLAFNLDVSEADEYVDMGNIANWERTQAFSVECWMNSTQSGENNAMIARYNADLVGWLVCDYLGHIALNLVAPSPYGSIFKYTNASFNNGNWHHVVVTYDGTSLAAGVNIYVDGSLQASTVLSDSLSGSILNSVNLRLASSETVGALRYRGKLDEVLLYEAVLSANEIAYRYNNGNGREDQPTYQQLGASQLQDYEYEKKREICNWAKVYGAPSKTLPDPWQLDAWSDALTNWSLAGLPPLYSGDWSTLTLANPHRGGLYSIDCDYHIYHPGGGSIDHDLIHFQLQYTMADSLDLSTKEAFKSLTFAMAVNIFYVSYSSDLSPFFNGTIQEAIVRLIDTNDKRIDFDLKNFQEFVHYNPPDANNTHLSVMEIPIGPDEEADGKWTKLDGTFSWNLVKKILWYVKIKGGYYDGGTSYYYTDWGEMLVDWVHFDKGRWTSEYKLADSDPLVIQYGRAYAEFYDESAYSTSDCYIQAKFLVAKYKEPIDYLDKAEIDYSGMESLDPGQRIQFSLPEGIFIMRITGIKWDWDGDLRGQLGLDSDPLE